MKGLNWGWYLSFSSIVLGFSTPTVAQTTGDRCVNPATPEDVEFCANREPERRRLRPSFSEEERRGLEEKGFSSSFLNDALNGMSDPLGGGTVGGGESPGLDGGEITPLDRGLVPAFDPTDVIIPTSGIKK